MPIPVLTALILIFIVWLQYEIRKTKRHSQKDNEDFWQNEINANLARRKDISNLNYITINLDALPMKDNIDTTINSYRDTIRKVSDKKILNLFGMTNTDLKYQYGAANINLLAEYDNNYLILVSILQKWADRLYTNGDKSDAKAVLEYAISCSTDVAKTYKLLAQIYKEQNTPEKIDNLIDVIQKSNIVLKEKLIEELTNLKNI